MAKKDKPQNSERNHSIHVRVTNITEEEKHKLSDEFVKVKRIVAPEGIGTIVEGGEISELPSPATKELESKDK